MKIISNIDEEDKIYKIKNTWISTGDGGDWLNIQSFWWITALDVLKLGAAKFLCWDLSHVLIAFLDKKKENFI